MPAHTRSLSILALCLVLALCACSRRPRSTAEVPRSLPAAFAVSAGSPYMPFSVSPALIVLASLLFGIAWRRRMGGKR